MLRKSIQIFFQIQNNMACKKSPTRNRSSTSKVTGKVSTKTRKNDATDYKKKPFAAKSPGIEKKTSKPPQQPSNIFKHYMKVYKGLEDFHMGALREVQKFTTAKSVLYPGSGRHINPSLFFPNVTYVDSDKKTGDVFNDPITLEWVNSNKQYSDDVKVSFLCKNFSSNMGLKPASFDLVISSSAGIVSDTCKNFCKIGGHFLASDAHLDARKLYLDPNFELAGFFNDATKILETNNLEQCFIVKKTGLPLTSVQVDQMLKVYKRIHAYPLIKTAWFYLFRRVK